MMITALLVTGLLIAALDLLMRSKKACALMPVLYSAAHLLFTVMLVTGKGEAAGYFRVDHVNAVFLFVLSVVLAGVSVYNYDYLTSVDADIRRVRYYAASFVLFAAAMTAAVLSSNLGLTWVFIEATTLASAYLVYFKGGKAALEAAWKYIFICSIGIAFAFAGIIFLIAAGSGAERSLSFDSLLAAAPYMNPAWLKLGFVFILIGFGTKAGLAPVHAWLPDAHSEAPSPVSALLSATLLNTAILAIIRIDAVARAAGLERFASAYLLLMGVLSVFVAAVYIIRVGNYKRMLAYSSIENMGVLAIALSLGPKAFPLVLIQAAGHSLSKAAFFLTSGNVLKKRGVKEISAVTGLLKTDPPTAWLWMICFVMISAIPPSPLFVSEFLIVRTMFGAGLWPQAALVLVLLTAVIYGMANAVFRMCFGQPANADAGANLRFTRYVPQGAFIFLLLFLTFIIAAQAVAK